MSFIREDFGPVGSQARRGVVPQVFSYTTTDTLGTVKGAGYFPQGPTAPVGDNMLGIFSSNDAIHVASETGGTVGFAIIRILNDGSDGNEITTQPLDIRAV